MIFNYLLLIAFVANTVLAAYIYYRNPRQIVNRSFAFLIGILGLWNLSVFFLGLTPPEYLGLATFFGRIAFSFASLALGVFVIFALVFPNPADSPVRRSRLPWILAPAILVAILCATPYVVKEIEFGTRQFEQVHGPLRFAFFLYAIGCQLLAVGIIGLKYWRTLSGLERAKIRYAFLGIALTALVACITNTILPMLGNSDLRAAGPSATLITVGCITYSIVRHRLMDISLAFRSLATYGILAGFFLLLISGCMMLTRTLFPELDGENGEDFRTFVFTVALLTAPIASFGFAPVRRGTEAIIDAIFFRKRYDYQRDLMEFGRTLTTLMVLDEVQTTVVRRITELMNVSTTSLLLKSPRNGRYVRTASWPSGPDAPQVTALPEDSPLVNLLRSSQRTLVREEMQREMEPDAFLPIEEEFKRLNCEAIVPLLSREELLGIMSLGRKVSRDVFYSQDINLLSTLGNEVAIALENATLHSRIVAMKEHTDDILRQMASGVVAIDLKGKIVTFNRSASRILQIRTEKAIGSHSDILPGTLKDILHHTISRNERVEGQNIEISVEGTQMPLGVNSAPLKEEDESIAGALVMFSDLSQTRRMEREMRRADRLATIGLLAAGMAHEIKNPLVSIRTFAQLLPHKYQEREFREDFAASMTKEVDRINNLVDHLLDLSRPSSPLIRLVNPNDVMSETLNILRPEMEELNTSVRQELAPALPFIQADGELLKQVFMNILLNAAQSAQGKEEAYVRVTTWCEESGRDTKKAFEGLFIDNEQQESLRDPMRASHAHVLIKIQDNGCGIAPDQLSLVFDPFYTTKNSGSGLGLSIAKNIVLEQNGLIGVKSAPDQGTSFLLAFPAAETEEAAI